MNKIAVSGVMLELLLIGMLTSSFAVRLVTSEPRTWTVDDDGPADFHTIQEAINAANEADTILVYEGYYAEGQIDIYKNGLALIASGNVTIDGLQQSHVVNISANDVSVNGFTIQNSGRGLDAALEIYSGIKLKGHDNNITNNSVTNNYCGIHLVNSLRNTLGSNNIVNNVEYGIVLNNSQNNTITLNRLVADGWHAMYISHSSNNTISLNNITEQVFIGIDIVYSSNNMISSNIVTNGGFGIAIDKSPNNTLRNNIMANNTYNFGLVTEGLYSGDVSLIINDVDASNTVNGKPVYYWVNKRNMTVPSNAGFVALVNCTNIKVNNLDLERNLHGITLLYTDNTGISGNNVPANHRTGIYVLYSFNNTISLNNITDNERGISIAASPRTNVFLNTITSKARYHPGNGINIVHSPNCNVTLNNIVDNWYGAILDRVSTTTVSFNNIISNQMTGIAVVDCSDTTIFSNNFMNNTGQVYIDGSVVNWDGGYPSGGNYWSDYTGVDVKSGSSQDCPESDGIGDAPYVIDANNTDRYPLINLYGAPPPPTYALTTAASVGGTMSPAPGTYTYTVNSTVEVTAIPEVGYFLDYWELDDVDVGLAHPYTVLMNRNHTLKAVFSTIPQPLSALISPLSALKNVGETLTFTSTVSGGTTPYSYQWYLDGNPVSGATSNKWTFTPTTSGIYYVYLRATDDTSNSTQSETARITVATVPVGGYSLPIKPYTITKPLTPHLAVIAILLALYTIIKHGTHKLTRKPKKRQRQ